jgi:hypothetical protein
LDFSLHRGHEYRDGALVGGALLVGREHLGKQFCEHCASFDRYI